MRTVSLRERFFPLHQPADVDRFLGALEWCVIFKAGTSDKTFDAWDVAQTGSPSNFKANCRVGSSRSRTARHDYWVA
jgi:hypothetical protein